MPASRRRPSLGAAARAVIGLTAAAALAVTVLPGQATAGPAATPPAAPATVSAGMSAGVSAQMLAALERDLGLAPEEAAERIAAEEAAAAAAGELGDALEGYAGSWIADDGGLVVATSEPAEAAVIEKAGAEAAIIEYGLAELEAVQKRLADAPVSYVDVAANRVVIEVADRAEGRRLLKAAGVDPAAVTVVVSAEQPELFRDLYGGDIYYAGNARCTVGFTARKGSRPGFITAGHCGRVGTLVTAADRTPLGVFRDSVFPGRDMAWVEVGPEWTLRGAIRSGGQIVPVTGSQQAPVGAAVCRTGSTTGWHCGTIQQHNVTVSYPQGTVSGLTRTSICAEPGDSGGPVISGSQAQGILSGGSGNCRTGGTTFYQPVNPILLQFGLTLVVGG